MCVRIRCERRESRAAASGPLGQRSGVVWLQLPQSFPAPAPAPQAPDRDMNKKTTLLWHFEQYLVGHGGKGLVHAARETPADLVLGSRHPVGAREALRAGSLSGEAGARGAVHMRKWLRTKHATIFRLSDRTIQVTPPA